MTDKEKNEEKADALKAEEMDDVTPTGEPAVAGEPAEVSGDIEAEADTEESPAVEGIAGATETGQPSLNAGEKVANFVAPFLRDDHPSFNTGDTIKVHYKIIEGNKERIQVFEGVVIAIKHSGLNKTFTVRKVSWNVGVERTFFYHSRKIDKIQPVRRGRVRRAKIYYLRDRVGKAARIKELRKPKTAN